MIRRFYLPMCPLIVALTICGCNSVDDPPLEAAPAVAQLSTADPAPPKPPAGAKTPELAEPNAEDTVVAQFSPPFPDRLDLFDPPKRAKSTVRRDDAGETVELKGFVNVDQPEVILAIDGVISPIPEGGEKYGVQVISIEPPSVFLQRGRNRWKATLE